MVTTSANTLQSRVDSILDPCVGAVERGEVESGLDTLNAALNGLRRELAPAEWRAACELCRQHPMMAIVRQDPLMARAYEKPRGYAGDALTLDYHYREWAGLLDGVSPLGVRLLEWETRHPVSYAVRDRCRRVAETIDATAARAGSPRILSVASGHVREAKQSMALREGRVAEFIALDQDAESLARLGETCSGLAVTPLRAKIKDLLKDKQLLSGFDLIYSIGMYDYLDLPTAQLVTRALFDRLNPGGRLLIGNFLTDMPAAAYGECFGDWWLILRTPDELSQVAGSIPKEQIARTRVVCDQWHTIAYLEIDRS